MTTTKKTDKKLTFDDLADRNWVVSLAVEKQGQRFSGSLTEVRQPRSLPVTGHDQRRDGR